MTVKMQRLKTNLDLDHYMALDSEQMMAVTECQYKRQRRAEQCFQLSVRKYTDYIYILFTRPQAYTFLC